MFTLDTTIDTVQGAKKEAIKHFVKNEEVAKTLTEFVDAQTAYTKEAFKATTDVATKLTTKLAGEAVKLGQEAMKADHWKQFNVWTQDWTKATKAKPAKPAPVSEVIDCTPTAAELAVMYGKIFAELKYFL